MPLKYLVKYLKYYSKWNHPEEDFKRKSEGFIFKRRTFPNSVVSVHHMNVIEFKKPTEVWSESILD